ncbi:MAG: hypothetical protein E6R05_01995 [Candidatus Moraniibacteriota bacterium]|nr:MAG: hypothetical protein E6R05_01995 [Candidatus Moranbacteria bacterium]
MTENTRTKLFRLTVFSLAAASLIACSKSSGETKEGQLLSTSAPAQGAQSSAEPGKTEPGQIEPGSIVPGQIVQGNPEPGGIMGEPGCSTGAEPGAADSSPGWAGPDSGTPPPVYTPPSASGTGPDTPVSSEGTVSSGDATVSVENTGPQHEWTREEMLLARPMPMSKEERDFAFSHKAPETIRTWTLGEFQEYTKNPLGARDMISEGTRWISLRRSLSGQLQFSKEFLGRKKINPPPRPKRITNADGSQSPDPEFLTDNSVFAPARSAETFEKLKTCRQDISDLCKELEQIHNQAAKKGRLQALENAISNIEWE